MARALRLKVEIRARGPARACKCGSPYRLARAGFDMLAWLLLGVVTCVQECDGAPALRAVK